MLSRVDVTNASSDTLQLFMSDSSNGYVVKEIDGLDPVAAVLTSSSIAQLDGAQAQNARRDIRNITIKLGLEPDFVVSTVASLRKNLYKYFLTKKIVQLDFYVDNVLFASTTGQVEDMQAQMFTADPEADISIVCYNPDFKAPDVETVSLSTTDTTDTDVINYAGTSDAGVVVALSIDRTMSDFSLYNTTPSNQIQTFDISGSFLSGDVVTITSVPGMKSVILTRAGIDTSILFWMDVASNWITLENGENLFRVFSSGAAMDYTVTYLPLFGAI